MTDNLTDKVKRSFAWNNLDIAIEHEVGDVRFDGAPPLKSAYGFVKKTVGADNEALDVYIGPNLDSPHIFRVKQMTVDGLAYDECKWFIGYDSAFQATFAYLAQMPPQFFGGIDRSSLDEIRSFDKK